MEDEGFWLNPHSRILLKLDNAERNREAQKPRPSGQELRRAWLTFRHGENPCQAHPPGQQDCGGGPHSEREGGLLCWEEEDPEAGEGPRDREVGAERRTEPTCFHPQ